MSARERRPAGELTAEEKTTVNRVLSAILRVPSAEIEGGNLLRDDLCMDSVQAIECLAVLEKELRLVVDPEARCDPRRGGAFARLAPWIIRTSRIMGEPTPLVANWGPMFVMTSDELHRMWSTEGWVPVFTHPSYATLIGKEYSFNPIPQRNLQAATLAGWQSDPSGCFNRCLTTNLLAWSYVPGTKGWRQDAPWLFRFGQLAMLGYYLFVLAGAIRLWRENRHVTSILVTQAIVCAAVTFPVPAESRYLIPAYLLLLPLAMVGLQATVARWRR